MDTATCSACSFTKPLPEMLKRKSRGGAFSYTCCLDCHKVRIKRYYNKNRADKIAAMRVYNAKRSALAGKRMRHHGSGTRWDDIRAFISWLKSVPCTDCGRVFLPCVMDLDHVHGEKLFGVSQVIGQAISEDVLWDEILKCEIVCSNCHRLRTWKRKHP